METDCAEFIAEAKAGKITQEVIVDNDCVLVPSDEGADEVWRYDLSPEKLLIALLEDLGLNVQLP